MSFDDLAKRMHDGRRQLSPLPPPVTPARRRLVKVAAHVAMYTGVATVVGGVMMILWLGSSWSWQARGIYLGMAVGVGLIVKATKLFDAVESTAPLPHARLRR